MLNRRKFIKSSVAAVGAAGVSTIARAEEVNTSALKASTNSLPSFKKGSRLLFQGDSITDMNRGRNEKDRNHYLGHSYVFILAGRLGLEMPEAELDFYNRGKSGNAVWQLKQRWQTDAIELKPDLLSILIGTNDVGQSIRNPQRKITPEAFESDYRFILDASMKANPNLRLVLLDPFVLRSGGLKNEQAWNARRGGTDKLRPVVAQLAKEYNAVHIKTQELFDEAVQKATPEYWLWDGVHPLPQGHELIARNWLQEVAKRWPAA